MSLQKNDFILIDYTAKVKETNEVFDTTNEETAKKEHLYKEGDIYEPKLVAIGEGWVLKALDESLTTMELNKPATVEIPPEKAFGARDAEKVKRVPLKQLTKQRHKPSHRNANRIQWKNGEHTRHRRRTSASRLQPPPSGKNPSLRRHRKQETRKHRRKNSQPHTPQNPSCQNPPNSN